MAENSAIEWTDHTFNPWRGCTKVSEGCKFCYAERDSKRFPAIRGIWGPNGTRVLAAPAAWKQPLKWDREAKEAGVRARVFCSSLADVFEDWEGTIVSHTGNRLWMSADRQKYEEQAMPKFTDIFFRETGSRLLTMQDVRNRLFALIDETPHLDWILVTKRPENILKMWPYYSAPQHLQYRENVWLLTSVENQAAADKRIPELLKCRDLSPVLGLSCEPLLGPVDFSFDPGTGMGHRDSLLHYLDWAICGGESGNNARPMHPDWARSLRDHATGYGVPFFFKQWGEWWPHCQMPDGTDLTRLPVHVFDGPRLTYKVGKKAAGRLLDGVEWSQFPEITD